MHLKRLIEKRLKVLKGLKRDNEIEKESAELRLSHVTGTLECIQQEIVELEQHLTIETLISEGTIKPFTLPFKGGVVYLDGREVGEIGHDYTKGIDSKLFIDREL